MADIAAHREWHSRPMRAAALWHAARLTALALLGLAAVLAAPSFAAAQTITGEVTLTKPGDYARLLVKLAEDVESDVKVSGSVLIVRFRRPIDVPLDKLEMAVPDYVSSVRRDPDGSALRFALSRKVTVNVMNAGERLFVDLLPEGWSGLPPPLPQAVVLELAERAKVAERKLREQKLAAATREQPPIRVRASLQPTFLRFIFELPHALNVSTDFGKDRFSLMFESAPRFDLADAKSALTPNVAAIEQRVDGEKSIVELSLIGDVDVHSFREDRNYIVDVGFEPTKQDKVLPVAAALTEVKKPDATEAAAIKPAASSPAVAAAPVRPASPPDPALLDIPEMSHVPAMPVTIPNLPRPNRAAEPRASSASDAPAGTRPVLVETQRNNDSLKLTFPFAAPTPAAMFQRGQSLWLVFDNATDLDLGSVDRDGDAVIRGARAISIQNGMAVRLDLSRPKLANLSADGSRWILSFADVSAAPSQPLAAIRNIPDPSRASIAIPFAAPGRLHRFVDPDVGDTLAVVTGGNPIRGFIKQQNFLEFSILDSIHGVLLQPKADDLSVELTPDKIIVGRPGGLTLSSNAVALRRATGPTKAVIDLADWKTDRSSDFLKRIDRLSNDAAAAAPERLSAARLDIARFYMARGFYLEAKGMLDIVIGALKAGSEEPVSLVMRAAANILSDRPAQGLADLGNPVVGDSNDAGLWRALALARQGQWAAAREGFKNVELSIATLPIELQQVVLLDAARASLEVRDFAGASAKLDELAGIGVPAAMTATVSGLRGRLAEALGQDGTAASDFQQAMRSGDRAAAADATWRQIALQLRRGALAPDDAMPGLETLAVMWRGDSTEVSTLNLLSRLYAERERYRDSFLAARTATRLRPNAPQSRDMQDRSSELFSQIFLTGKGEGMPPVDALALFYEFRELTPIGRRGDEMIRRLADRLVAVDLLDQASELLQYQIDKRLEGAARATVATRLAMVYLMNRKPERAVAALQGARMADLAGELRQQRLLLEARAQSDIGRQDLAYDLIANIPGREAVRLRGDIRWAQRRWGEASEQIELLYGERWRDFQPLAANEKADILRAAIGYALGEDAIGLNRLREKYAAKFTDEPDRTSFDNATRPDSASGAQLAQIARMAASVDTLDGFLREMKVRFPDVLARAPLPPETVRDPVSTGALPQIRGLKPAAR